MPEIAGVQLDASNRIDCNLLCSDCAYNLRTCPADGDCPECGTSIADSIEYKNPYSADPAWLHRLVLGGAWIVTACAIVICHHLWFTVIGVIPINNPTFVNYFISGISGIFSVVVVYTLLANRVSRFILITVCLATLFGMFAAVSPGLSLFGDLGISTTTYFHEVAFVAGYWLVTTREPLRQVCSYDRWITYIARFGVIAWYATSFEYWEIIDFWMGILPRRVCGLVASFALCIWLMALCKRLSTERLVRPLKWLIWLMIFKSLYGIIVMWLWFNMRTLVIGWIMPDKWIQIVTVMVTYSTQLIIITILMRHWRRIRQSILAARSDTNATELQT